MANIQKLKVKAGDVIEIDDGIVGRVVFTSIEDDYAEGYAKADWGPPAYEGIMIEQENGAVIFHDLDYLGSETCRVKVLTRNAD